jgi:predicted aminopeptidase
VSNVAGSEVVYVVTAARRDRLESYTWWFPFVGTVPYKGFFSLDAALKTAKSLENQRYDTYVRPAGAFSTLGWFNDPLLSSLLKRNRVALAITVFHELFHNTLFVAGEMDFNESAANFAGSRAAVEFFCEGPSPAPDECRKAEASWRDTLTMSRFLASVLEDLENLYASSPDPKALDAGRARIFSSIRERFRIVRFETAEWAGFGAETINNASLLHDRTYLRDLGLFEDLYRQRGRLSHTIADLRAAVEKGGDPFERLSELVVGAPANRIAAGS